MMMAPRLLCWKIIVIILWIKVCYGYDTAFSQAQRIDELEIKLIRDRKHVRQDLFDLRRTVMEIEKLLNSNLGEALNHDDEPSTDDTNTGEEADKFCTERVEYLKNGFRKEKFLNVRTRRSVEKLNSALEFLQQHADRTEKETKDMKDVLEHISHTMDTSMNTLELLQEIVTNVKDVVNEDKLDRVRPKSCLELLQRGHDVSGLYHIYPGTWTKSIEVYCDQDTDGGGWTVFQRREDGFVDFYRGWLDYKLGFGNLLGEFWLGNENIHLLAGSCCNELRIDLADFRGNNKYAMYKKFQVGSKNEEYVLTVEKYSGDAGDSLGHHSGATFTTKDNGKSKHCSIAYKGGWWYTSCHSANLNGLYLHGNHSSYADGIEWSAWTGQYYSLKFSEMKFREVVKT